MHKVLLVTRVSLAMKAHLVSLETWVVEARLAVMAILDSPVPRVPLACVVSKATMVNPAVQETLAPWVPQDLLVRALAMTLLLWRLC